MHCTKQNVYGHYSEHIIIYSFLCQAEKRLRPRSPPERTFLSSPLPIRVWAADRRPVRSSSSLIIRRRSSLDTRRSRRRWAWNGRG